MTLRRRDHDVHDEAFAAFVDDVRAAVPSSPREETAERHLAAMRAAAEESTRAGAPASGAGAADRTGRRRSAGPVRPVLRLGAVTAGAVVAFSGFSTALAAVGVDLPEPVRAPFEAVGIELPNQPADEGRAPAPAVDDALPGGPARPDERSDQPRRERPAERERQKERSGERRGGKGKARGRNATQPGKQGGRGRSDEHRRDGTAPNGGDRGDSPGARGRSGASRRGGTRSHGTPSARTERARPQRERPQRPRPTGPKRRTAPAPQRQAKPTPPPETAPETQTDVAPAPEPTTTTP